jgi:Uma2 family endonuclease
MSATITPPARVGSTRMHAPAPKVWTVEEFHDLGDRGVFEGRGAMLIHGVIVEEGPMNHPHATAATKTEDAIREAFGKGWHVRVAKPLVLGQSTDPQPDAAVIRGRPGDYTDHPTTADLVIEISDTSFRYDTTEKLALYATAGIADYWVLDVNGRQLHVFRGPAGDAYATHQTLGESDTASPLAAPTAVVRVADLLP